MKDYSNEILDALNNHTEEFCKYVNIKNKEYGYKDFTKKIKTIIGNLGEAKGFDVLCSGVDNIYGNDNKEFIYDLTWVDIEIKQDKFPIVKSVPLVLESEISGKKWGQFKEDFDKLLLAKSSYKLMIFTKNNQKDFDLAIKYAGLAVESFSGFEANDFIDLIYFDESGEGDFKKETFTKKI